MKFGDFAGFAMFDQGFYEVEKTLWSEPHKYTAGRPNAVMNVYENASVEVSGKKSELAGDVVLKGGTVVIGSTSETSLTFMVPNGINTATSYGDYTLKLNLVE